jgi:NADH dehydrogenase FAD-containing subunit
VNVDEHLRVQEGETSRDDIYALGDITSHPYRLLSRIPAQISTVAANLAKTISKKGGLVSYYSEAQRQMMVVPVGESTGTGHVGGWKLPGFLVWYFKGMDFLVYKAPKFLKGEGG